MELEKFKSFLNHMGKVESINKIRGSCGTILEVLIIKYEYFKDY